MPFYLKVAHPEKLFSKDNAAVEQWRRTSAAAGLTGSITPGQHWVSPDLPPEGFGLLQDEAKDLSASGFPTLLSFLDTATILVPWPVQPSRFEFIGKSTLLASSEQMRSELMRLCSKLNLPPSPEDAKQELFKILGPDPQSERLRNKKWRAEAALAMWTATGFARQWSLPIWSLRVSS